MMATSCARLKENRDISRGGNLTDSAFGDYTNPGIQKSTIHTFSFLQDVRQIHAVPMAETTLYDLYVFLSVSLNKPAHAQGESKYPFHHSRKIEAFFLNNSFRRSYTACKGSAFFPPS